MDAGLSQPANNAAELKEAVGLFGSRLRSPSLEESSGSHPRSQLVALKNRPLNHFPVECIFKRPPSALLILELAPQDIQSASGTEIIIMSMGLLPVQVRVKVAFVPRLPLLTLIKVLSRTDESTQFPVFVRKASALLESHPDGSNL